MTSKGASIIGANLKYYFTDLGLRNARLNFRQQEPTHIMENIVYNELCIRGYHVDVGIVETFGRDSSGKRLRKQLEVDSSSIRRVSDIISRLLRPHLGGEAGAGIQLAPPYPGLVQENRHRKRRP